MHSFRQYARRSAALGIVLLLAATSSKAGAPFFNDSDPESTPVDGGAGLLVAAGIGYGIKKIKERRALMKWPGSKEENQS